MVCKRVAFPLTNTYSLYTGHGIIGTTHAEDIETLVNRVIEQGLPPYLLREIDLVVFPHHVGGERYVAQVVELLAESEYEALTPDATRSRTNGPGRDDAGIIEKGGTAVHYNTVGWRDSDGTFRLAADIGETGGSVATSGSNGAGSPSASERPGNASESERARNASASGRAGSTSAPEQTGNASASQRADGAVEADDSAARIRTLVRLADRTDRDVSAVEAEFDRKHRYVQYLVRDGVDDFDELFEFLADLRTDEAATVERAARTMNARRHR